MMKLLGEAEPKRVWKYFLEMTGIPRCSMQEERIVSYILRTAASLRLDAKRDSFGNILIRKPAAKGCENKPGLILQGHVDMVCEKNPDVVHDFEKDPLSLIVEGDWLRANGTTLGADNGIGCAMALAVLEEESLEAGPIEVLLTLQEEVGLVGAVHLEGSFFEGKKLINLDSAEEGVFYIGCAGGTHTIGKLPLSYIPIPRGTEPFLVKVGGLAGGHSGEDIHLGRGNALRIGARVLVSLADRISFHLAAVSGGEKPNAIPRDFSAAIFTEIPENTLKAEIAGIEREIAQEYAKKDSGLSIGIEKTEKGDHTGVFSQESKHKVLRLLYTLPHGVEGMSSEIDHLVETSTNLASVRTEGDCLTIVTSQRSSIDTAKEDIARRIRMVMETAGAQVRHENSYPGWKPNSSSPIVERATELYAALYGSRPRVTAVHAGLECGVIGSKTEGMDMISFGPAMTGIHTPEERLNIPSVGRTYDFLVRLIESL